MPTYEYRALDPKKSCDHCIETFEEMHSIIDDAMKSCPECGSPIERQVTAPAAVLWKGRQMNQYSEVRYAKYWRDNDGNRHKVTPGDGDVNSGTVPQRRKRSDEQVVAIKKRARARAKERRTAESYKRYVNRVNRGR